MEMIKKEKLRSSNLRRVASREPRFPGLMIIKTKYQKDKGLPHLNKEGRE